MDILRIAVDGPAGAGKSTVAKELARIFNLVHIDTGAMYRAAAYKALKYGVSLSDDVLLATMLDHTSIEVMYSECGQRLSLDGEDVTEKIRTPEVSRASSDVSTNSLVRVKLVELQKELARGPRVVMDGRDIGTVVMPDATHKIFLTATPAERALRRYEELDKGNKLNGKSFDDVLFEIERRDHQDINREHSPLKKADDAIEIDTSKMTMEQVLDKITDIISKAGNV